MPKHSTRQRAGFRGEAFVDKAVSDAGHVLWAGADVGKRHHWISAVDEAGAIAWSQKVVNDEAAIIEAVGTVSSLAAQVQWAVDMSSTPAALLLAILAAQDQRALHVPGRVVHSMAKTYQGEGKTDARDAFVIAETARQRRNLQVLNVPPQLVSDLRLFTSHRADLIQERTRTLNRLRNLRTGVFPALERAFDYASHQGAVILLTGY